MNPEDSKTSIPNDLLVNAMAQAMKELLKESGVVDELLQTIQDVRDLYLLKEGLLTYEQGAKVLQMSVRTFEEQVGAEMWPKVSTPGRQARVPLQGLVEVLLRGVKPAATPLPANTTNKIAALLHPPDGRRKKAA